jgi:metallo-beta-lactamase class B
MIIDILKRPWAYYVEPFSIVDNLYYVGNSSVSSHLIDTGDGLLLIDTGFPQTVYLLLESIRRLGFDLDKIQLILHTHGHYDHFGGTKAIVELTGTKTAIGEEDIAVLTDRPELSWAPEYGVEFYETFQVNRAIKDGDVIRMGNISIECVHTPGHTAGAMSYFFEVANDGNTCIAGIHGGPGTNTLTDSYFVEYGLSKSMRADYMQSVQKLKQYPVDIFLGSHPDQNNTEGKRALMKKQEGNPFIDNSEWPRFLHGLEDYAHNEWGM